MFIHVLFIEWNSTSEPLHPVAQKSPGDDLNTLMVPRGHTQPRPSDFSHNLLKDRQLIWLCLADFLRDAGETDEAK